MIQFFHPSYKDKTNMSYKEEEAQKRFEYYQKMDGNIDSPSIMASREERDAYTAQEVGRGNLPSSELSEAYGGRPRGSSRRAIRMQDEWDLKQDAMVKQQGMEIAARQAEENARDASLKYAIDDYDFEAKKKSDSIKTRVQADVSSQKYEANRRLDLLDPASPEFPKEATAIRREFALGFKDEDVMNNYTLLMDVYETTMEADKERRAEEKALQAEQDSRDETQAEIAADVVTYGVTPEEQAQMLEPNLPAGVVRFNPNASKSVIAGAKLRQEEGKEAKTEKKAEDKDFTSRLRESQKALAAYNSILATEEERIKGRLDRYGIPLSDVEQEKAKKKLNTTVPELVKALAEARGAAAVLDLPMIQDKSDLSKYKSGDRVLAPDGITVMLVP